MQWSIAQTSAAAVLRPVEFVDIGIIDHPSLQLRSLTQCQRDAEVRQAMDIICGAVKRVQNPLGLSCPPRQRSYLLRQNGMIRKLGTDGLDQMLLRASIHLGYQVCPAFELNRLSVAKTLQENSADFPHDGYQKFQDGHKSSFVPTFPQIPLYADGA